MIRKSLLLLHLIIVAFFISLCSMSPSAAKNFDDSQIKHIGYPDWFNESPFYDLTDGLKKSRLSGKKGLMVLFTTEGCSYCDVFIRKSLGDPEIAASVQKSFDSVGMEIFDDVEMIGPRGISMPIKQFATKEGVQFSPTLLFYGNDGNKVLRVTGYQSPERFKKIMEYVVNNHYRTESLHNFLKKQKAKTSPTGSSAALKTDTLFGGPPYALDRSRFPASKPLLVIFEKPGCTECAEFHSDVLALKKVRKTLKRFEVVRFDAGDVKTPILAPDGKKTSPALWYEQAALTRVPAILFFDEKGNEVLKTDTLVLHQRMMNSLNYVLEQAYKKGWTYQRFARTTAIERSQKKRQ
ncbi:MAG: thioredoxin fold domain-containing protein [Gammaproteobacteria bacterium]